MKRSLVPGSLVVALVCSLFTGLAGQDTITVMTYNLLSFPDHNENSVRTDHFVKILMATEPDIIVANEMRSQTGVDDLLNKGLKRIYNDYEAGPFTARDSHNNAVFYRDSRVSLDSVFTITTAVRDIDGYVFRINDHADSTFRWTVFVAHLKAGNPYWDPDNPIKRWAMVKQVQTHITNQDTNYYYAFAGDFNFYKSSEPGYTLLMDSMSIDLEDPLDTPGNWHDGATYDWLHTQSTRISDLGDGGSTGGMDDRFDFILLSHHMLADSAALTYVQDSYQAYGNDGQHFNKSINDTPANTAVPSDIADALYRASDHLPVILELAYPSKGELAVSEQRATLPTAPQLHANYPNPFNPCTTLNYDLPKGTVLALVVYDVQGREVVRLTDGYQKASSYKLVWDGSNSHGRKSPSGIYIARLVTPEHTKSIKMLLLR